MTKETLENDNEIIAIYWSVDDVLQECNWLTREQAINVLHKLERKHDACLGINWTVINTVAQIMYPETEE